MTVMEEYKTEENEVSIRDYILRARDYFSEVLHYWYIPAVCILLVTAYQLYKYYTYTPVYPATITFSVDEDETGSQSGLAGMLSQFGLGSVRPARYNFDKILELSRSRRVVQNTLFGKTTIDGKEDFIANHIIRIYEFAIPSEDPKEKKLFFFTHDSLVDFTRQENEVLISLYHFIIGPPDDPSKALLVADYNEDTNIMSLTSTTKNETLSLDLADRMFKSLSDYYINKAIEKSLKTYKIITNKRDSILGQLRSSEYQLANFDDRNRGLMMRTDAVGRLRLQRDVTALTVMYGEVLKNVEVADFSLRSK
ncbi:MAG TPA: hypothetical protein VMZ69_03885, partial [Saprospiraceae bacterium]|nr:hypothetical protein [Saprospiraceae bacterium]